MKLSTVTIIVLLFFTFFAFQPVLGKMETTLSFTGNYGTNYTFFADYTISVTSDPTSILINYQLNGQLNDSIYVPDIIVEFFFFEGGELLDSISKKANGLWSFKNSTNGLVSFSVESLQSVDVFVSLKMNETINQGTEKKPLSITERFLFSITSISSQDSQGTSNSKNNNQVVSILFQLFFVGLVLFLIKNGWSVYSRKKLLIPKNGELVEFEPLNIEEDGVTQKEYELRLMDEIYGSARNLKCRYCGTLLSSGDQFCHNCGVIVKS